MIIKCANNKAERFRQHTLLDLCVESVAKCYFVWAACVLLLEHFSILIGWTAALKRRKFRRHSS